MSEKILQCRWCGSEALLRETQFGSYFVKSCCKHDCKSPTMTTKEEAISAYNDMMTPTRATIDTSYRDRVDMMVGHYISAMMSHRRLPGIDEKYIAAWAIRQVDAIDNALKDLEARDV